jgi:hypothetical protein
LTLKYNFQEEEVMEKQVDLIPTEKQEAKYIKPKTEKHEPVKIIQGSGSCGSLYYVSLYGLYS